MPVRSCLTGGEASRSNVETDSSRHAQWWMLNYPVTFNLYRDGVLALSVAKHDAFRLPPGRADSIQLEVTASVPINRVAIATSISELRKG